MYTLLDSVYNFEGKGVLNQRVYGMSYAGNLDIALGEHRSQTTASDCFIHSGENLFLTVQTTAACATSLSEVELAAQVKVYPNPTTDFLQLSVEETFRAERLVIYNLLGAQILSTKISGNELNINVQGLNTGPYLLQVRNKEQSINQRIQIVR